MLSVALLARCGFARSEPVIADSLSEDAPTLQYLLICSLAFVASGLTFFTGFGLGTLLLPAFALFFPVEIAVSLTAVVHLLNSLFKLGLVGRRADLRVALRFGMPAIVAAYAGAHALVWLSNLSPLASYEMASRRLHVMPVKLALAALMVFFACFEVFSRLKSLSVAPRFLPLGGLLAGFFGGLSGHQGALRSAFLIRAGLSKEAFIATGAVIATVVDLSRLVVYAERVLAASLRENALLLAMAAGCGFLGAFLGSRLLHKVTLRSIEVAVAILLVIVAVGLGSGVL